MDNEQNNDALEAAFHAAPPSLSHSLACPRCGNFVRGLLPGLEACEACIEKVLPEGVRGPLNFSAALAGALHLAKRIGPMAIVITLAFEIPGSVLFAFSPELPFQVRTLYGLFTLIGDLLIMSMAFDALLGRPTDMKEGFSRATSRYGAVFRALWISNIITLVGMLLLVVPGIYMAMTACLAAPVALLESHAGQAAFKASCERTKGHWFLIAGTYGMSSALGFIFAIVVGIVSGVALEVERQSTDVGAAMESSIEPLLPYVSIATDIGLNLFMLLALFFQMVVYTKTWLTLQEKDGLPSTAPIQPSATRQGRDALDEKLDAELAKLD